MPNKETRHLHGIQEPPQLPDKPACQDCRFWESTHEAHGDVIGECRRNAPRVLLSSRVVTELTVWPLTDEDSWCGEFRLPLGGHRRSDD